MNKINKTRILRSNSKRNKEQLEILHLQNYPHEQPKEEEEKQNQTLQSLPPSHEIQNYSYDTDSSNSENDSSGSNADQSSERHFGMFVVQNV